MSEISELTEAIRELTSVIKAALCSEPKSYGTIKPESCGSTSYEKRHGIERGVQPGDR